MLGSQPFSATRLIGASAAVVAGISLFYCALALVLQELGLNYWLARSMPAWTLMAGSGYFVGFIGAALLHEFFNMLKGEPTLLGRFQDEAHDNAWAMAFVALLTIGLFIFGALVVLALIKGTSDMRASVGIFLGGQFASEFSMKYLRDKYIQPSAAT